MCEFDISYSSSLFLKLSSVTWILAFLIYLILIFFQILIFTNGFPRLKKKGNCSTRNMDNCNSDPIFSSVHSTVTCSHWICCITCFLFSSFPEIPFFQSDVIHLLMINVLFIYSRNDQTHLSYRQVGPSPLYLQLSPGLGDSDIYFFLLIPTHQ